MLKYFSRFGSIEKAWNRHKHPGIAVGSGIAFTIDGEFLYGTGCSIGEGANIIVRRDSSLVLGEDCYLGRYVEIAPGGRIVIGTSTSIQDRCIILGNVNVGAHCIFAPNIFLSSGNHHFDVDAASLIRDQDERVRQEDTFAALRDKPIVVEDDCWLGINAVVMRGVTIGRGAVIGAGAIVVKDVMPYTVVGGVPAREIRKRLEFIPPAKITGLDPDHRPYFYSGFELSRKSVGRYAAHGGIAARKEFTLALDATLGQTLHIIAKCIDSSGCKLIVGREQKHVGRDFVENVFDCDVGHSASARIAIQLEPIGSTVIVKQAWMT